MCGITLLLFPLILILSSMTGCIEEGSQPLRASSLDNGDQTSEGWSSELRMEIDPELKSDLFCLRGNVILIGTGNLPYLLLNANLRQGNASVVSTKYLLMKLEPNRDYSFEIAKNLLLLPGEYICTLEASGPSGMLSSESRKCSLAKDQTDSFSAQVPSSGLISLSDAQALFAGRTYSGYDSVERASSMETNSRMEKDHEIGSKKESVRVEKKENSRVEEKESEEELEASYQDSRGKGLFHEVQDPGEQREEVDARDVNDDLADERDENMGEKGDRDPFDVQVNANQSSDNEASFGGIGKNIEKEPIAAFADQQEPRKDQEEQFVASSTSKKYHLPECRYALKIKQENRIYFHSHEEAEKEGYLPCKVCNP